MSLLLVLLVVPVAIIIGLLLRGDGISALADLRVRGLPWAVAGAAVQLLRTTDPTWAAGPLHAAGRVLPPLALALCATGFALANARGATRGVRAALAAMLAGALANALTTALNGGMPFSVSGARAAGIPAEQIAAPPPGHVPIDDGTALVALADVIGLPGLGVVLSVGDLLLWGGLAAALVIGARRSTTRPGAIAGEHHPSGTTPAGSPPAVERSTP
ncbi:DUF5317 family protein [Cellulomonas timonensis]|uniref:DUF5317 family protein n=1 Tax=Cellulomonas timonensis TaxID=1689271 RepID=UPI000831A932|nr:DUF5317 family protein [Cellulomonas timonensis]